MTPLCAASAFPQNPAAQSATFVWLARAPALTAVLVRAL